MDFESKQLKSSVELAAEKTGLKNPENSGKLRTAADMAMEKVKLMQMDADVQQGDAEKIAELAKKSGLDLSHSIAEKQEKAAEIKQEMAQFEPDTVAKETVEEEPVSKNQETQPGYEDMAKKYGFRTKEENERAVGQTNKELKSYSEAQENETGKKETTEESDIQKIISTQNRLNDLRANVYRERMSKRDPSWHGTAEERAEIDQLATEVELLIDEKAIVDKAKSEISERNFDLGRVTNEDLLLFHQRINKSGDEIEADLLKDADIADSVIEDSRLRLSKLREDARVNLKEAGDDPNLKNTIDELDRQIGQLVRIHWKMREEPMDTKEENSREIKTTPESTDKNSKDELKTKEQVQSEALTDFRNELKGIKKNEQWQGNSIMQGMEDFINSQKEKTPTSETFKDMFSFIKNKGAEINKGIISTKDAASEFSKKSREWAAKIFKNEKNAEDSHDKMIKKARKEIAKNSFDLRNATDGELMTFRRIMNESDDKIREYFLKDEDVDNISENIEYQLATLEKLKFNAKEKNTTAEIERQVVAINEIKKSYKEKISEVMDKFGSSLEVTDAESPTVFNHIEHLSLLPKDLVETMKNKGLKIKIGNRDMLGLSDDEHYRNNSPRGWKNKANWEGVGGCYHTSDKIAYAGKTFYRKAVGDDVVLHEYGHGMGQLLGLDNLNDTISAHNRLYDKLTPYQQQEGPGGVAGRQEFVAESVAAFFTLDKKKFIKKYDNSWYASLEKSVNEKHLV